MKALKVVLAVIGVLTLFWAGVLDWRRALIGTVILATGGFSW